MMVLPDMMSWSHFVQLPRMKNLPINEQVRYYNQYLAEQQALYAQVMAQTTAVGSGGATPPVPEIPLPSNCIEFTVDTTVDTYFVIEFNTSDAINFTIDWGDGDTYEDSGADGSYSVSHSYPESNQQYVARVCFDDPSVVTSLDFLGDD